MSDLNYIHVMGFETEEDLELNRGSHIDSVSETGEWEASVQEIVDDNRNTYFHITVENDNGKPLSSFL